MAAEIDNTEAEKSASEIVGSVDDLLLEIFRRVPSEKDDRNPQFKFASKHLKSLVSRCYPLFRLRLVSRHWNSLISNNFLLPKPFPAAGIIFECGPSSLTSTFVLFVDKSIFSHKPFRKTNKPWQSRSKAVHSCNGLLLCASRRERDRGVYSVCNPTTGKHSALPKVLPANNKKIRGVFLVFDPCESPHYKVVCVLGLKKDFRICQFVVYSSQSGCWGKCGKLFKTNNVRSNGVYWNGAIHWVGSSQLICFNPGADDCQLAPPRVMPMPIARNHDRYYFGESYGHLHYIGLEDGVRELVVHEMSSDYSAGWVVKCKVDVSDALRHISFYDDDTYDYDDDGYDDFDVLAVVRGERSEDNFLVLGTGSWKRGWKKIVRFNHDYTFETIYDFSGSENTFEIPDKLNHPFQHIESLARV